LKFERMFAECLCGVGQKFETKREMWCCFNITS